LGTWNFNLFVCLNEVAYLDVWVGQDHAALVASTDLVDVVLFMTQRLNLRVRSDDVAVADNANLAVALDLAVGDHTTSDGADSRGLEQCTDLCPTGIALFVDWLEHALECLLNFFDSTVDNGVVANIDAFSVGFFRCLTFSANVEGNDDSVRGCSQGDVGLGNRTNAAVDDVELYLVVDFNIEQGVFQCFHRTCVVTLEDEVEGRSLLEYLIQILEGNALAGLRLHSRTLTSITLRSNLACNTVIFHNQQVIAGTWNTIQALNLDRTGWTSFFNVMTELIKHATNATEGDTHNNGG